MGYQYAKFSLIKGTTSRQAHTNLPEGTFEREIGKEGFIGPATQMYHKNPPTAWTNWEGPLSPRAFDTNLLTKHQNSPWHAKLLMGNNFVEFRFWRTSGKMDHLVRNGDGDDLLFIHRGKGHFYCDYGHLEYSEGDYIVVPRSTSWRIESDGETQMCLFESTNGSFTLPDKGIVGRQALFDQAMLDTPELDEAFKEQQSDTETWRVAIKRRKVFSTVTFPYNPLDCVGWTGDLTVYKINIKDIRPLNSHRYHLPPMAHTTFVANRFVICSFVPRPFETAADALKIPFFHNNDDYDEVLFYHNGDFFSRDNIDSGAITIHPCGFTHGPHPKALNRMHDQPETMTNEYAVMLDTRDALDIPDDMQGVENKDYVKSWNVNLPVKAPSQTEDKF